MQENEQRTRYQEPKKRLRKGRLIVIVLLLIIGTLGTYSFMQFRSGKQLASSSKIPEEQFEADDNINEIENFLILGIDTRGEEKSRTDTMMLLSWNRETNSMKLVSFMRDVYAEIPGYQSYKLNTAYYLGGVQLLKSTLNNMFEVPIHHYAMIDFKSFESLIDILAPNGIEMDVEKDMSENIYVDLKKGVHRLNGQEMLGYARFRMDGEGDFGRVRRQQQVIEALKNELTSPGNAKNLPKFIGAGQGYVTSNLTSGQQLRMALGMVAAGSVQIEKMTIPAENTYTFKSYRHAGEVIEIDLQKNKQILHDFLQLAE